MINIFKNLVVFFGISFWILNSLLFPISEEMEFLVKVLYFLFYGVINCGLLWTRVLGLVWTFIFARLNCKVELCNFMGIHSWRWHFDWTTPIEVVIAESIGQLLNVYFWEFGLVQCHEEMGWKDASLRHSLWH